MLAESNWACSDCKIQWTPECSAAFGLSTGGISCPPCFVAGLCPWALSKVDRGTGVLQLSSEHPADTKALEGIAAACLRTHPQPYARKFLVGFPEPELMDCTARQEQVEHNCRMELLGGW